MAPVRSYDDADMVLFFDTFGDCTAVVLWEDDAWHFLPRAKESGPYPTLGPGESRRVVLTAGAIELPPMCANTVEFHDAEGLAAVAYGQFTDELWLYATRADDDWKQHLLRIGVDGSITMITTVGRVLVNEALPPELRSEQVMDKSHMDKVLGALIQSDPDKYVDVSHKLLKLGGRIAYEDGVTIKLSDLRSPIPELRDKVLADLSRDVERVRSSTLDQAEANKQILALYTNAQKVLTNATYDAAIAVDNPLALQVRSKARGNKGQLAAALTTPGLYTDRNDEVIPKFIGRSFAQGLDEDEYWASTYGARKSVIATKRSTAKAGALGKQFSASAYRTIVTADDCGTGNGLPVPADDPDNIGSVLAQDAGPFKAGAVVTRHMHSALRKDGIKDIVLRSPVTCGQPTGVCGQCVGIRERGRFPAVNEHVGISATTALAERVAQGTLNCLEEGTLVRMADNSVSPIELVRVGDMVRGADRHGRAFPVRVTGVWNQGIQPVRDYVYRVGGIRSLRTVRVAVTDIHTFLATTPSDKTLAKRTLPDGIARLALPCTVADIEAPSVPFARLLGVYLGDGCRSTTGTPIMSCADLIQIADMRKELRQYGIRIVKCQRSHDWRISDDEPLQKRDKKTGRAVSGARNKFKAALEAWGLIGKYAHEKRLPAAVHGFSTTDVCRLLAGYLVTDGSVYVQSTDSKGVKTPGISFGSTSKGLLEDIQGLIESRLAVYTSGITRIGYAGVGKRTHDMWQFYVSNAEQVRRLFSMLGEHVFGVKASRWRSLMSAHVRKSNEVTVVATQISASNRTRKAPCWDLTVDHEDHLYVLANGLITENTKHSGGQKSEFGGFSDVENLTKMPKIFPRKAALAPVDGVVSAVEEAPQGGTFITVGDERAYVPHGFGLHVQVGDRVEAGDVMSDGIPDPREVVTHKGLGEGRRYFVNKLTEAFRGGGYEVNRRNVELLGRAMMDHVRVTDPDGIGDLLPDEIVPYSSMAFSYKPRPGGVTGAPASVRGMYMEQPALHYTIGTRITKSVADNLDKYGVKQVSAHKDPPMFEAQAVGLRELPGMETDWMAQLSSSYLKSNLLENAAHNATSDIHGTHPIPGIAKGTEFGKLKPGQRFGF